MTVNGRFSWRHIVKRSRGNDDALAVARRVWHRAITAAADLSRKAFRFRQIEAFDQVLAPRPTKLPDRHGNIRRAHAAGCLAAARAVAVTETHKWRAHLIANRFAKATTSKCLFGHDFLRSAFLYLSSPPNKPTAIYRAARNHKIAISGHIVIANDAMRFGRHSIARL